MAAAIPQAAATQPEAVAIGAPGGMLPFAVGPRSRVPQTIAVARAPQLLPAFLYCAGSGSEQPEECPQQIKNVGFLPHNLSFSAVDRRD